MRQQPRCIVWKTRNGKHSEARRCRHWRIPRRAVDQDASGDRAIHGGLPSPPARRNRWDYHNPGASVVGPNRLRVAGLEASRPACAVALPIVSSNASSPRGPADRTPFRFGLAIRSGLLSAWLWHSANVNSKEAILELGRTVVPNATSTTIVPKHRSDCCGDR
jgi:hypothetical protein